ncbi:hypothetical protein BC835DRAFT_146342 [Cytidiella melzeri]|nr:hypothetical protein BC835DRAFT_146342 [Cytidiella melzeri]
MPLVFSYPRPRLPTELVSIILDWLTSNGTARLNITKAQLSSCSLTCRYWASRCRPLLFREIKLASREDAQTLLHLLQPPNSEFGVWLRFLVLIQKVPSYPWTHLIYMQLSDRIPKYIAITHVLEGNTSSLHTTQNIQFLHPSLPRTLPASLFRCFDVHLINLRFRSAFELVDLVGKLHACSFLRCKDVSWAGPVDAAPRLKAGKRRLVDDILLHNCPDAWVYIWLCVTTKRPTSQDRLVCCAAVPYVESVELQCLGRLVESTCQTCKCGQMRLTREGPFSDTGFSLSLICEEKEKCTPDLSVQIDKDGMISSIRITFGDYRRQGLLLTKELCAAVLGMDWKAVDRSLSRCTALRELRIDIYTHFTTCRRIAGPLGVKLSRLGRQSTIHYWDESKISTQWPHWTPDSVVEPPPPLLDPTQPNSDEKEHDEASRSPAALTHSHCQWPSSDLLPRTVETPDRNPAPAPIISLDGRSHCRGMKHTSLCLRERRTGTLIRLSAEENTLAPRCKPMCRSKHSTDKARPRGARQQYTRAYHRLLALLSIAVSRPHNLPSSLQRWMFFLIGTLEDLCASLRLLWSTTIAFHRVCRTRILIHGPQFSPYAPHSR